jgi:response regulator RpfG family c-di-GMP phosphodiesterase
MTETQARSTQQSSNSKRRILIVDDEPSIVNLLAETLRQEGYSCSGCQSGKEAMHLMNTQQFDVILSDVHMPGMSGLELLRLIREKHPRLASVIVTGEGDVRVGVQAMKEGADDYLLKPFNPAAVAVSINQVLDRKKLEAELENYRLHLEEMVEDRTVQLRGAMWQIDQIYDETLQALAAALDLRDNETAGHSRRVMKFSVEIAKEMGCSNDQLNSLIRGALLHDIGKIGVPDAILRKHGPLTNEERALMNTHVRRGYNLLNHLAFLAGAAEIVLTHQEQFDGGGYPQGFLGTKIPLGARIFAVADTLDAMTSDRPYRPATTLAVAREEIVRQSGKQFDPAVVSAFLAIDEGIWAELRVSKGITKSLGIGLEKFVPPSPIGHALQSLEATA